MNKKLFVLFQYLLPQRLFTRFLGYLAEIRQPWFKNYFIRWFVQKYQIDLRDAERERPEDYIHFNDFFTRALKAEARPLDKNPQSIISPADGTISAFGSIRGNVLLQAKNHHYSLEALMGSSSLETAPFQNGKFITIYLSPKDYHRVHMPWTGHLLRTLYIPGTLFSVNATADEAIPNIFSRNERLVCLFETEEKSKLAVIMVGAMIVAGIHTVWAEESSSDKTKSIQRIDYSEKNILLHRGDELGFFSFGSTVIVLFDRDMPLEWTSPLTPTMPMMVKQTIGRLMTG